MENTRNKTEKGFWLTVKTVGHFLLLLTIKGFSRPSKPKIDPAKEPTNTKKGGVLIQLLKFVSGSVKKGVGKEVKDAKDLLRQKSMPERRYKTWARVKQDFRDYYKDMKEEFEPEETISVPQETLGNKTEG